MPQLPTLGNGCLEKQVPEAQQKEELLRGVSLVLTLYWASFHMNQHPLGSMCCF